MKKNLFIFHFILLAVLGFAQNIYVSSDGYFFYNFSDDFSEYTLSTLENPEKTFNKITCFEKSSISFWKLDETEYVKFQADDYFVLKNEEKQFVFVKDGKLNEYWQKNRETAGIYQASSEKRMFNQIYDVYNLLYFTFTPWIPNSENYGIGETISFESTKNIKSFRIINGFVDINNPSNFEKYGKAKKINVYSKDKTLLATFDIENNANIQTFILPFEVSYLTLEIVEVYKGTENKNLAITTLQFF